MSSVKNSETPDFGVSGGFGSIHFLQGWEVEGAANLQIESGFEG